MQEPAHSAGGGSHRARQLNRSLSVVLLGLILAVVVLAATALDVSNFGSQKFCQPAGLIVGEGTRNMNGDPVHSATMNEDCQYVDQNGVRIFAESR